MKQTKKSVPSNNEKKLLSLLLLASACLEAEVDRELNNDDIRTFAVIKNTLSMAGKIRTNESLDTVYNVNSKFLKAEFAEENTISDRYKVYNLCMLTMAKRHRENMLGLTSPHKCYIEFSSNDVKVFLTYLNYLDREFNTKQYVDTIKITPVKTKVKKIKKERDKKKKKVIKVKTKKVTSKTSTLKKMVKKIKALSKYSCPTCNGNVSRLHSKGYYCSCLTCEKDLYKYQLKEKNGW